MIKDMSFYFADKTWPELKGAIEKNSLILLPIGTIEEHGKHLPVSTDMVIAKEVTHRVAEGLKNEIPLLVMPAIWSGYSTKEISRWPGTMRLKPHTFMDMVFDIVASLVEMGFKKIVLISSHGNHTGMLEVVARRIADEYGIYIAVTFPHVMGKEKFKEISKSGQSCHGCEYETSLMLYLHEDKVDMKKATNKDKLRYVSKFYPDKIYWSTWGVQKSKTGIYGDPTVASKKTGKEILKAIVDNYIEFLKEFYTHE